MAVQREKQYTVEEFDEYVNLPENSERLFEFIGGEIVEVPSNPYSSEIAATIIFYIKLHLRDQGLSGHVTTEAGGYMVSGECYAPDVAYLASAKQPVIAKTGYNPTPPDLAVEVVSPTDDPKKLLTKVSNYLVAGTVVWVVYPDEQQVVVHQVGAPVRFYAVDDTVDGGDVLPGFKLPVRDIFAQ